MNLCNNMSEKKPEPKPITSPISILLWAFFIFLALSGIISFFARLLGFTDETTGLMNPVAVSNIKRQATVVFSTIQFISLFVTLLFIMGIIYASFRVGEIKRLEKAKQKAEAITKKRLGEKAEPNKKWIKVVDHVNSPNAGDWRLAILEADILLEEVLDKMGYKSQTVGEKLKSIERSDLDTLDNAWEAHKIRNAIAHQGSNFNLNQKEARRVIALYESVFKETFYI